MIVPENKGGLTFDATDNIEEVTHMQEEPKKLWKVYYKGVLIEEKEGS